MTDSFKGDLDLLRQLHSRFRQGLARDSPGIRQDREMKQLAQELTRQSQRCQESVSRPAK